MPGALEAVDGILAQADSGSVTAGEATEELLSARIVLRNNRRLEAAMRSSRLVGFGSVRTFHRAFRRHVGRTPTQYRKEWRRELLGRDTSAFH